MGEKRCTSTKAKIPNLIRKEMGIIKPRGRGEAGGKGGERGGLPEGRGRRGEGELLAMVGQQSTVLVMVGRGAWDGRAVQSKEMGRGQDAGETRRG